MSTQHDPWQAPSLPRAHPSGPAPARLPGGPQGRRHGVRHSLRTSLGLGLVIVLLGQPRRVRDRLGPLGPAPRPRVLCAFGYRVLGDDRQRPALALPRRPASASPRSPMAA